MPNGCTVLYLHYNYNSQNRVLMGSVSTLFNIFIEFISIMWNWCIDSIGWMGSIVFFLWLFVVLFVIFCVVKAFYRLITGKEKGVGGTGIPGLPF